MNLKGFVGTDEKYSLDAIAEDMMLRLEIQEALATIGYLKESPEESWADRGFDQATADALLSFQTNSLPDTSLERQYGYFGTETATALIEAQPTSRSSVTLSSSKSNGTSQTGDMASRIYNYMVKKDYKVFTERKQYNIVYVEGMGSSFTLNDDVPDEFNDLRLVLEVQEGKPAIVGKWEGTTEPGKKYTINPLNAGGAARIQFAQQRCWQVGVHNEGRPSAHKALVQTGGAVTVHRDRNKDFKRTNDNLDKGHFGINQHWGFDFPKNDIRGASAGCLVGRTTAGHKEFMAFVMQDKRYEADSKYVFYTTVIAGDDLMKSEYDVISA